MLRVPICSNIYINQRIFRQFFIILLNHQQQKSKTKPFKHNSYVNPFCSAQISVVFSGKTSKNQRPFRLPTFKKKTFSIEFATVETDTKINTKDRNFFWYCSCLPVSTIARAKTKMSLNCKMIVLDSD